MRRATSLLLLSLAACSTEPAHWFVEGVYDAELTVLASSCPEPAAVFDPWWDAWICRLGSFDADDEVRGSDTEAPVCPDLLALAPRAMEITLLDDSAYTHEFELADDQLHFYGTSYVEPDESDAWFEDVAPRVVPGGGDRVPITVQLEETRSGYAGRLLLLPVDVLTNESCGVEYDLRLRR